MSRKRLTTLTLAAIALVAFGCGGSTKAGTTTQASNAPTVPASKAAPATRTTVATGNTLTRTELLAAANRVCARANARIVKFSPNARPSTEEDLVRSANKVASYDHAEAAELRALVPPASLADDMKQIVTGFQTYGDDTVQYGREIRHYAQTKDPKPGEALIAAGAKVHDRIAAIARHDGLKDCAKPTP